MCSEIFYNNEIKQSFINEKNSYKNKNFIESWFKKSAPFEKELDKDLCYWDVNDIISFYKLLNTSSYESLRSMHCIYSQYASFCIDKELLPVKTNNFLSVTNDMIAGCINKALAHQSIFDRDKFVSLIEELMNPRDQFVLLGTFEFGTSPDNAEIVNAKPSDLIKGEKGYTLKFDNREVKISDKLANIIKDCIATDVYYCFSDIDIITRNLKDFGYLIKSYPNQNRIDISAYQNGRNIYNLSKKSFDYLGVPWMTLADVANSGKIYTLNMLAKKYNISVQEFIKSKDSEISEAREELENQYYWTSRWKKSFLTKFHEYLV